MIRSTLILMITLWGCLIVIIAASLFSAASLASDGSILITHNLFLDRQDRFIIYDISRQFRFSFTPETPENTIFVALAPRGRKMAALIVRGNQFYLTISNYRGENLITPILANNVRNFDDVRWSSDGRYFIFYDTIPNRDSHILILDTQSGDLSEIPYNEHVEPVVAWSANNEQIAYGGFQIWIADSDGQNNRQLSPDEHTAYCPTWSPDGETLAYLETVSTGATLRFIHIDGTPADNFPSDSWRMTSCPFWSSDAQSILFIALDETHLRTNVIIFDLQTGTAASILSVNPTANLQIWR